MDWNLIRRRCPARVSVLDQNRFEEDNKGVVVKTLLEVFGYGSVWI